MTVHTEQRTVNSDGTTPAGLIRLRRRESVLRQQAAQYQARAEHLERVASRQAQQLGRRIDAHEKIVLGALVKKAGLAVVLTIPHPNAQKEECQDNAGLMPSRRGIAAESTACDRALILGSLMWLASALNGPDDAVVTVPERHRLREDGQRALDNADAQRVKR